MSKILVMDLETTGLSPKNDKIVEIGLVSLDLKTGSREIVYDNMVLEPGMPKDLSETWIVKNGYLTEHQIRAGEALYYCRFEIQKIIDEHPLGLTAYNRAFDVTFMHERGFNMPKLLPCPMRLSTNLCRLPFKTPRPGSNAFKWPTVEEAYRYFFPGTEYKELHRAADDAYHEAAIVYELFKMGIFKIN